ncbi:MAG TPA: enoyl-CoA hydratase-related protein [Thermoanaerobaculaceae bacterium]|nr:enoyl-CoA hydratase-related protein [Thermoanaerobaculaceae bacterium]HRS15246.1 enoyl-CoA hydratase-related protein [Thermoanaerobaculaceae bacterium]
MSWRSLDEVRIGRTLRLERHRHGVWCLVLARARARNALNGEMVEELERALATLHALPSGELRVAVLEGEGDALCAGADLAYMRVQAEEGPEANLGNARALATVFRRLASLPVPLLGAVHGAAMGGGLGLVACCDIVVAAQRAVLALPEVRLGLLPAVIGPYLVRKLGVGHTAALAFTGRRLTAREAMAVGLVQRVVPAETFDRAVGEVIGELLQAGPEAARRTKALLLSLSPLPSPEVEERTVREIALARVSDEGQAGLAAFLDKRPAPWVPPAEPA